MKKIIPLSLLITFLFFGCKSSILDDPSITIQFSLAHDSNVKLTIENNYDTVVKILIDNAQMTAGAHQVTFDQNNLAEGVYYYTLEARGIEDNSYYKITKNLLLVKP